MGSKRMPQGSEKDEEARLRALRQLQILDTLPEPAFQALAALASNVLGCPMSLVTLIDRTRQWVKASVGVDLQETDRDVAFCDHTIRSSRPLVVENATADPRFADNPLVAGAPTIRFYAGMPLHAIDPQTGVQQAVGAICGIDTVTRSVTHEQHVALEQLGHVAEAILMARSVSKNSLNLAEVAHGRAVALQRSVTAFRQAERIAAIGSWRYEVRTGKIEWSEGVYRIHELPEDTDMTIDMAMAFFPASEKETVLRNLGAAEKTGKPFDFEVDFVTATGRKRRVRSLGERNVSDGQVTMAGVFQDVTERYELEQNLRRLANTDELTGLANRAAFDRVIAADVESAARGGRPLLLVLVDLDHFKQINDEHGHGAGDDVLRAVGRRLATFLSPDCSPARLGGDEFAVIVRDPKICAQPGPFIDRLMAHLKRPVPTAAFGCVPLSVTAGYDLFATEPEATLREFVHRVDSALYAGKRAGRGGAHRFASYGRRASDERRASQPSG